MQGCCEQVSMICHSNKNFYAAPLDSTKFLLHKAIADRQGSPFQSRDVGFPFGVLPHHSGSSSMNATRRTSGSPDLPYKCDICDKCFQKQSSLTRHKYEHTGKFMMCY